MVSELVKELREHGQIHKHNNRYTVGLLNQAAEQALKEMEGQ